MKREPEVSAVEQYLRQATRGLWGRKRREVREELEAHLVEQVWAHRIAGLGEADAVERALSELGSPREVSVGMTRLYTLPTVVGSGLLTLAAASLSVALLTANAAPALPATFYWPSVECVQALEAGAVEPTSKACIGADDLLWLDQEALQAALEPQGVTFSELSVPGGSEELTRLTFPDLAPVYMPLGSSHARLMNASGKDIPMAPGYFSFWDLVKAASYQQQDLRIAVEGWDNPTVHFNTASLQIGTDEQPVNGLEFYENYLNAVFFKDFVGAVPGNASLLPGKMYHLAFDEIPALRTVSIPLPDGAPGVYGIITRLEAAKPFSRLLPSDENPRDVLFMSSVARSSADGTVSFELPKEPLRFVDAFSAAQPEGTSILVRLGGGADTGGGWYEVIAPERIAVR